MIYTLWLDGLMDHTPHPNMCTRLFCTVVDLELSDAQLAVIFDIIF